MCIRDRLGWDAIHLDPRAGNLARVEMWQAAIFALGIAIGIIGSAVALACSSRRAKALGASIALLGLSCVVMGFVMARYLRDVTLSHGASQLRLVLPSMLIVLSLAWFVSALRDEKKPPEPVQEAELTEEQPQPLSRS